MFPLHNFRERSKLKRRGHSFSQVIRSVLGVPAAQQDERPLTAGRALGTFAAAQLLSVPLMLVLINVLLFAGGICAGQASLPPPPATPMAVGLTLSLCLGLLAHGLWEARLLGPPGRVRASSGPPCTQRLFSGMS